jgi:hypothetical protein
MCFKAVLVAELPHQLPRLTFISCMFSMVIYRRVPLTLQMLPFFQPPTLVGSLWVSIRA